MRRGRFLGALGALALLAAASWLPPRMVALGLWGPIAAATARPTGALTPDLARPALPLPQAAPAHAVSAAQVVQAHFLSLALALHPSSGKAALAGDEVAYAAAYAYLDPAWQARLPFARFVARWKGIAHLDLLQIADAGPVLYQPESRRVFVEVREYLVLPALQAVAFARGVFTARYTPGGGWLLTNGGLRYEDVAAATLGGAQVWRSDPGAVARAQIAGAGPGPRVSQIRRTGHLASVDVNIAAAGGTPARSLRVHLAQLVDGTWETLYAGQ